jgi:hypothetical protein
MPPEPPASTSIRPDRGARASCPHKGPRTSSPHSRLEACGPLCRLETCAPFSLTRAVSRFLMWAYWDRMETPTLREGALYSNRSHRTRHSGSTARFDTANRRLSLGVARGPFAWPNQMFAAIPGRRSSSNSKVERDDPPQSGPKHLERFAHKKQECR